MRSIHSAWAQVRKTWGQQAAKSPNFVIMNHSRNALPWSAVYKLVGLYKNRARIIRCLSTEKNARTTDILADLCTLSTAPISNKQLGI